MTREWLETDGRGGFASGPVTGARTRRYHALLLAAEGGRRWVLVSGVGMEVETPAGAFPLTVERYVGGGTPAEVERYVESFTVDPWPTWHLRLPDGTRLRHEVFVERGGATHLRVELVEGTGPIRLRVRPFLAGRDYHALMHENGAFRFNPEVDGARLVFRPYDGVPPITVGSNGRYAHEPTWYRRFLYAEESARGLDDVEDLAAPGELSFALDAGPATIAFAAGDVTPRAFADARRAELARRSALGDARERAALDYIVERPEGGKTIIAGYPWFTDWGRDTFIAVRGLCLATGRLADAREILVRWTGVVSEGMLPNRFPDGDGAPEYNSVDAALWFVVAAAELIEAGGITRTDRERLLTAIEAILRGHATGTRHGIHMTDDGLLAAGARGVQLTWMDAKIGDWVVTPRIGKPVEVQALWLNALALASRVGAPSGDQWQALFERGRAAFETRFWDGGRRRLFDVVDVDHVPGTADPSFRPNQIVAVGGLPIQVLAGDRARRVVDAVEEALVTPLGLRSLAPSEPGYRPQYRGGVFERDSAYHQGTVWPWLAGPFIEAWVRVRGGTVAAKREARRRFLAPLIAHLGEGGVGHVSEVAGAEPPHEPGGCPFQAWSLGELLRLERVVLAEPASSRDVPHAPAPAP